MPLSHKPVSTITEADLTALVDSQVPEGRTLDYKRDALGRTDSDKREFLADVSSFANSGGGFLIFGMDEADGIATAVPGIDVPDVDGEIRRMDELIRDGLNPTILGLEIRRVPLANGRSALVIRIPKSWNPPHQVVFQKTFRFFGRGAAGKHMLDVTALRDLFTLSVELGERINRFRAERVARIMADETPVILEPGGRTIIHAIPLNAFGTGQSVEFKPVQQDSRLLVQVLGQNGPVRYNVDGMVAEGMGAHRPVAYAQLFRNGIVESVSKLDAVMIDGQYLLPSMSYEMGVINCVRHAQRLLQVVGALPPFILMVTISGAKGLGMAVPPANWQYRTTTFDRDLVFIPETLVSAFGQVPEIVAKPLLDATWQAAGWPGSINYDDAGHYKSPR